MDKLNSMRALERAKVPYRVHSYPAERMSAEAVALHLGADPARVFKTLVAIPSAGKPVLAMIPAPATLDLKALARALGVKQVSMATPSQAEALTGLQVGGIGALALLGRGWRCFLDGSALESDGDILVSAGRRGCNLGLAAADLRQLTGATVLHLTPAAA